MNNTATPKTTKLNDEIKEAFDLVDKAQIGKINREQLALMIKLLGYRHPQESELKKSEYSFTDAQDIIASITLPEKSKEEEGFLAACQRHDPDNTGYITIPQMAQVFEEFGESGEEFLKTMRLGEQDYGDQIDYKNFCSQMCSS